VLNCIVAASKRRDVAQVFKLSLSVSDLNDNSPVFQPSSLTVRVPETSAVGSEFVLPAAVDRDEGPRDIRSYAWSSNATDHFRLHVTGTGSESDVRLVVTGRLDHESEALYTATVTAVDGGSPAKSGSLDLIIIIQVFLTQLKSVVYFRQTGIHTAIKVCILAPRNYENICSHGTPIGLSRHHNGPLQWCSAYITAAVFRRRSRHGRYMITTFSDFH